MQRQGGAGSGRPASLSGQCSTLLGWPEASQAAGSRAHQGQAQAEAAGLAAVG